MTTELTVTGNPSSYVSGVWPEAAMNGGVWRFTFTFPSSSASGAYSQFCSFFCGPIVGGTSGGFWIEQNLIELYDTADNLVLSQPVTFPAGAKLTFTIDVPNKTITIAGATTGNGTFGFSNPGPYFFAGTTLTAGGVTGQSGFEITGTFGDIDDGQNSFVLSAVALSLGVGTLGMSFARRFALDAVALTESVGSLAFVNSGNVVLGGVGLSLGVGDLGFRFARRVVLSPLALALTVGDLAMRIGSAVAIGDHGVDFQPFPFSNRDALVTLTTPASGAVVLLASGGRSSDVTQAWTDNKSNTIRKLSAVVDYPDFTGYGTQLGVTRPPMTGGAAHAFTVQVGNDDEATTFAVAIVGGHRVKFLQATQANAGAGTTVAIGPIVVDGPAALIAFWYGSSPVSPPFSGTGGPGGSGIGAPYTAVPDSGFAVLDSFLSNFEFGEVQAAMAGKLVDAAGSYSVTWTHSPVQGALLWLAAVQPPLVFGLDAVPQLAIGVGDLTFRVTHRVALGPAAFALDVGDLVMRFGRVVDLGGVALAAGVGDLAFRFARRFALGPVAIAAAVGDFEVLDGRVMSLGPAAALSLGVGALTMRFARRMTLGGVALVVNPGALTFRTGAAVTPRRGRIAVVGQLFGLLQLAGGETLIDLIGPLRVFVGDSVIYRLTVTDDADERVDLTDAVIELQVKPAVGAADPATIAKAVGAGITVLDQGDPDTKGQADIAISSADTAIAPRLYWLDVVVGLDGARTHVIAPREFTVAGVVNAP